MDQTEGALLDHSSSTAAICHKLADEETDAADKLRELKSLLSLAVRWSIKFKLTGDGRLQPVQVHRRVEGLHRLTVVSQSVKLKDLAVDGLNVLNFKPQGN